MHSLLDFHWCCFWLPYYRGFYHMHLYVNIWAPKVYCNIYSISALAVFNYFSKRVSSDEGACGKKCTNTVPLMCSWCTGNYNHIPIKVLCTISIQNWLNGVYLQNCFVRILLTLRTTYSSTKEKSIQNSFVESMQLNWMLIIWTVTHIVNIMYLCDSKDT